jgi:hypothetical protein
LLTVRTVTYLPLHFRSCAAGLQCDRDDALPVQLQDFHCRTDRRIALFTGFSDAPLRFLGVIDADEQDGCFRLGQRIRKGDERLLVCCHALALPHWSYF